jgi:hypothetical protein
MDTPQQITLGQVLELEPGQNGSKTYVNDEFDAIVEVVEEKKSRTSGKAFWITQLVDPHNSRIALECAFFRNPGQYNGKVCHFAGGGMTREEYNGKQKLGLGRDTKVQIVGKAPQSAPAQSNGNGAGTHESGRPQPQIPPAAQSASFTARAVVEALSIIKSEGVVDYHSGEFAPILHTLASDILRVHNWLEDGKLAPATGSPPSQSTPPPDDRPVGNRPPIDEDVPF